MNFLFADAMRWPGLRFGAREGAVVPSAARTFGSSIAVAVASIVALTSCVSSPPLPGLEWMVGRWHGVRRDGTDGLEAAMRVRVEALSDGTGLVESLRVDADAPGAPYVGFAVHSLDSNGVWTKVYVNSTERPFARLRGIVGVDRTVWTSVTPERSRESRLVSEQFGPDRWRRTQSVSEDGGRTWRVLFTDELERDRDDRATVR